MTSPLIAPGELADLSIRAVLLDVRPRQAYDAAHLSGAIHVDLDRDLSAARDEGADAARGGRHPLPPIDQWAATLGTWGITPDSSVVVYDAADGSNAARAWWMLRASGHEAVRVLDGGFAAAVGAGLPVTQDATTPRGVAPYPVSEWSLPTAVIDEVARRSQEREWKVLDVRAAPRFRGETEPIDPVAGHIPGAVNLPFAENMSGGRWKSSGELREQYERFLGGTEPSRLIVHCGSGVTACHTLLALDAAQLHGAALYVGSWSEWCRSGREIAKEHD